MGNVPVCANKAQLVFDAARDLSDGADEWMGVGLLTLQKHVDESQLRLRVDPLDLPNAKRCKQVAKRPHGDDTTPLPARLPTTRSSSSSRISMMEVASRCLPYEIMDTDMECRRFEACVSFSDSGDVSMAEQDGDKMLHLLGKCASKDSFTVQVRVEVCSVGFKKSSSPFRDANFVEESIKQLLSQDDIDPLLVAVNYGNCIVEKVFCGALLALYFWKGGQRPTKGDISAVAEINLGSSKFALGLAQRGGDYLNFSSGGSSSSTASTTFLAPEQLEQRLRKWTKSVIPSRAQAVRLKLAPLARVEGLQVSSASARIDLERADKTEKAKEGLRKAARTRSLSELRDAVDLARSVALEDESFEVLERQRVQLDDACEHLKTVLRSQGQTIEDLEAALKKSESAGLLHWDKELVHKAEQKLNDLENSRIRRKLGVAAQEGSSVEEMVPCLLEAVKARRIRSEEFNTLLQRLRTEVEELTVRVKEGTLSEEEGKAIEDSLKTLPEDEEALDALKFCRPQFNLALRELRGRSSQRQQLLDECRTLKTSLESVVLRGENTHGAEEEYEELHAKVKKARDLMASAKGKDVEESVTSTLETLHSRGLSVLEEKRGTEEVVKDLERQLKDAQRDQCDAPTLEKLLVQIDAKAKSGLLKRGQISTSLLDSSRRHLFALLNAFLKTELQRARQPDAALNASGINALTSAREVLRRMELTLPTCEVEVSEAQREVENLSSSLEGERNKRNTLDAAKEKLRYSLTSGDVVGLEEDLLEAQRCGLVEGEAVHAKAKLKELKMAHHQVKSALESGDRVHLSRALEDASRVGLKSSEVSKALQTLQSSKTAKLVDAIERKDYAALGKAIGEAESRSPEEIEELSDLLERAKSEHRSLQGIAEAVAKALAAPRYEELRAALEEAQRRGLQTEDVKKAEGVLKTMKEALRRLQAITKSRGAPDIEELQESLHVALHQGLQGLPEYKQAEALFASACEPPNFTWSLTELREMWVLLCLRKSGLGRSQEDLQHSFNAAFAELSHFARLSMSNAHANYGFLRVALRHTMVDSDLGAARQSKEAAGDSVPEEVRGVLRDAWRSYTSQTSEQSDFQEALVDAEQFNRLGYTTLRLGLTRVSQLLWWLVCVVEAETGRSSMLAFCDETAKRTTELTGEAEATSRALRSGSLSLQVGGAGKALGNGHLSSGPGGPPEEAPDAAASARAQSEGVPEVAPEGNNAVAQAKASLHSVLEDLEFLRKEAERLQGTVEKSRQSLLEEAPEELADRDLSNLFRAFKKASPTSLEQARQSSSSCRAATLRSRQLLSTAYDNLEARLLQLLYRGREALDRAAGAPYIDQITLSFPTDHGSDKAASNPMLPSTLPPVTYSELLETPPSLQDHAFLQLMGIPERCQTAPGGSDGCFQRIEIYDRFSDKIGPIEEEFEHLCRGTVEEARQRCGGRRLIEAVKPLLVDLVKRRQCLSSVLNTLRSCGLDTFEKNLLRRHLKPRDILLALTFSSMSEIRSQARMMSLLSKTDSPLPLLFGWAAPASAKPSAGFFGTHQQEQSEEDGLRLCTQIHWAALQELFGGPSHPLVLSVGSRDALGKSYLLQYLYALQECHFQGTGTGRLRIHEMPSVDIIGDFAREESLRGVTLADVHSYDGGDELCETLTATLASSSELILLHVSAKHDFRPPGEGQESLDPDSDESDDDKSNLEALAGPTPRLVELLDNLSLAYDACQRSSLPLGGAAAAPGTPTPARKKGAAAGAAARGPPSSMLAAAASSISPPPRPGTSPLVGDDGDGSESGSSSQESGEGVRREAEMPGTARVGGNSPTILLLLRDADMDESSPLEKKRLEACIKFVERRLSASTTSAGRAPPIWAWCVPPLASLAPAELSNEVKTLRKQRGRPLGCLQSSPRKTLEEVLGQAPRNGRRFPSLLVLQERYEAFAKALRSRQAQQLNSQEGALRFQLPAFSQASVGSLPQRVFSELSVLPSSSKLLATLFPVAHCHQRLSVLLQQRQVFLNRSREYLEPDERRRLESESAALDREIAQLRALRAQAPPHALLKTFGQLVLAGNCERIAEFGVCLNDWKHRRRAPLLESKLQLRRNLEQLLQSEGTANNTSAGRPAARGAPAETADPEGKASPAVLDVKARLAEIQKRLDQVEISVDSFWLELMLWQEMERIGARRGIAELDERLTSAACKSCYLAWVRNGNPVHFLHSAPLQFGAFEPMRWHPQISGASLFGSDFIGDVLRELDRDLGVDVRRRPLLVISVIGVQSSGKSTLMNYLFGCSFATHVGRCTKGLYISLLETKNELVVILDTEGLLSVEARDDVFDKQVALMTMACSDLVIVNNRGELGRHVGDLFQVCLFALYHLKLARLSPAIGFVLQCLSMVNEQQQYEWVATVKKSLEDSVQELQQRERPQSFKLQDLVFLDSESIFVMPSAFNDDVQFGLQVSRPTNLYALKALQLREKVFQWIGRAKASQQQRRLEQTMQQQQQPSSPSSFSGNQNGNINGLGVTSSFASLSQWYDHARSVWQTLSMCGTDLLQFRTMRQVLMAQQLQEYCDALVQRHINEEFCNESEGLVSRFGRELRSAKEARDVHTIDNSFKAGLDSLRDAVIQEMQHEFDEFVRAHSAKFTDEQVKNDKRFALMGPMRRKYASIDSLWRSAVHLALEQRSLDHLFEEIAARVNDLLMEQGTTVNVQNVERVFEEKWNLVMSETLQKQRPNLSRVVDEVICHFNAALSNLKSQFRKAHIFHGVKALAVHELGTENEICTSFLLNKKGVGASILPATSHNSATHVDNLWIKLVDTMRLEVDQRGQMSDTSALKILNRMNSEMESNDQLRQLLHRLGSSLIHRIFSEIARATMHYRFQLEQQNLQARVNEILGKKQQKLWEIQARVDKGKREVHCAKVWSKAFVDNLDGHFKSAVGKMAQEIVSHMSNILTNPANACEMAIERSFTKRNWRHVVMYAVDPTQYLFMEFHKEWEQFKQGLVDQYCQELKNSFGSCLRIVEARLRDIMEAQSSAAATMTMNALTKQLRKACSELADESLSEVLCNCLPSFSKEADWALEDMSQFVQFATVELQRYRANVQQTEQTVERRMEVEIARQKANCWKCICGCTARCPGCGTKCNLEHDNHWPERPHECRRHLYPAFNGWQKQEGRKPFLLHCRARAQWQIARTRPPIEPGGPERYWDSFQEMLEDEHPDWLDPQTQMPLPSMEPLEDYEEDCTTAPDDIQREIEENRRAWANCKDALLEHFTSMADDRDIEWLDKFKREGGALKAEDFASIRDELFAVTPLESLDMLDAAGVLGDLDQGLCQRC